MDDTIRSALETDRTIDITTTGRKTGTARRKESWFHNVEGRLFITGLPGTRGWYANLLAEPRLTFHLKESVRVDLPAEARPVLDVEERRSIIHEITGRLGRAGDIEAWVERSPLVEVRLDS